MSNGLLSDVEARAQRRRTRTREECWQDLSRASLYRASETVDPGEAARWLERARRLAPRDAVVTLLLAATMLRAGDAPRAAELFGDVTEKFGTPQAFVGLTTALFLVGDVDGARTALAEALRRGVVTSTVRVLAARVMGQRAWCGLARDRLVTSAPPVLVMADEVAVLGRGGVLSPEWRRGCSLTVTGPGGPMLGSPLPIRMFAVEGFIEADRGGLRGWAWFPSDPARIPELRIEGDLGTCVVRAVAPAKGIASETPLHRPRSFTLSAAEAARLGTVLAVRGVDGRHLLGSPLDPLIETRGGFVPAWVDGVQPKARGGARRRAADVIVPVHGGGDLVLTCLRSVIDALPHGSRLIVVDDASPDPALRAALNELVARRRVKLLRFAENRGFPAACNEGLRAAAGRDAVLLNSDTLVPPGWLEGLAAAAYSAADIGTVTPLTNEGTVVSYPRTGGGNVMPDMEDVTALHALARRANGVGVVDLPVGVGFCLYVRRDCLDAVGMLREDLWAQGYGEENDFCLRAKGLGWRNVAATGVFVGHVGQASFETTRRYLMRRNSRILNRLHPGYDALIEDHVTADPLRAMRRRMDTLRWETGRSQAGAVVMVTHAIGGGVQRLVRERAEQVRAAGQRAVLVEPMRLEAGVCARVRDPGQSDTPNLVFRMPEELMGLVRLMRADGVVRVEIHHMLGHHEALVALAGKLGVQQVSVLHDYARFCGRIALVSTGRRYCGEPDVTGCEACIADLGSLLDDDPPVKTLLARSAAELGRSDRVVAPSIDAARRIERHFNGIAVTVEPWEDDTALPQRVTVPIGRVRRVVVVGAIGVEKGFEVLLGCARDAAARRLPLELVVVGFTEDDERLMAAGPVFVTGEFQEEDAVRLVAEQGAQLGFIPSVWPETWCFALTRVWQAGLDAVVFDLGAQAERVRRTGRGWVLPLGLSARALNDTLLRLAPVRGA